MNPAIADRPPDIAAHDRLDGYGGNGAGVFGWLSATTHQEIGKRYILTAFFFLLLGGMEALLMRLQLAVPENTVAWSPPL